MWIVKLALRRPYTIVVMAILLVVMGVLSTTRMVIDILPAIDIPVVAVVWNYPGLSAEDMERRVVLISERAYSSTVDGIQRIESQSIPGIGLLKIYFQPDADIGGAIAQISSVSSTILRITPPGMQPPNVIRFNASNLPVAQLTMSSDALPEQQIFDYGLNFIRVRLFTIPGLSTPAPFGGKQRQINVDIDPQRVAARGLSPADVVNALQASNVILPAGTARIGRREYNILTNGSPRAVPEFADLPVKVADGTPVLLGDVAHISDGFADQTNVVRVNGRRATYLAILRHAQASTLAVVDAVREALPGIAAAAPDGLELKIDFDQSLFVRGAIWSVLREAIISSLLVSLMIGAFLGSWRSMVVVCTSIPLAILAAVIGLKLTGHTINIMTLGGLALAIGMLVDDATVEVENIHRNRSLGKPLTVAILDGASQIAVPAIVATLSICIVFFPVVLLVGPARFLFTPLALAVVLAMLASYLLSRTLVPTLSRMLMERERHHAGTEVEPRASAWSRFAARMNQARDRGFDPFQSFYSRVLELVLGHRRFTMLAGGAFMATSLALAPLVGLDFFPSVDTGLMKLHFRAPVGTRIEATEKMVEALEQRIRTIVPPDELGSSGREDAACQGQLGRRSHDHTGDAGWFGSRAVARGDAFAFGRAGGANGDALGRREPAAHHHSQPDHAFHGPACARRGGQRRGARPRLGGARHPGQDRGARQTSPGREDQHSWAKRSHDRVVSQPRARPRTCHAAGLFLDGGAFQSWLDPLIIMVAIPGAFSGILWMLALTHTTLNVESFMGTIMSVGIAVSNSILLVSFANDHRLEANVTPTMAALEAGRTRLRPVLMTALAMIIGMIPMALGLGEAGEQNAPLGRAVIGGLLMATFVTLLLVPTVYASLRTRMPVRHLLDEKFRAEARGEVWTPPALGARDGASS